MSKKSILPQSSRHVMIFDEDWEFLRANYGPGSPKEIGPSEFIRAMIHSAIGRIRNRAEAAIGNSAEAAQ